MWGNLMIFFRSIFKKEKWQRNLCIRKDSTSNAKKRKKKCFLESMQLEMNFSNCQEKNASFVLFSWALAVLDIDTECRYSFWSSHFGGSKLICFSWHSELEHFSWKWHSWQGACMVSLPVHITWLVYLLLIFHASFWNVMCHFHFALWLFFPLYRLQYSLVSSKITNTT